MASPQLKTELCYLNIPARSKGPKREAFDSIGLRAAWMAWSACLGVSLWKVIRHRKGQAFSCTGWFPQAESADWHTCS